jgi:MauM/NapG family ferredoxin protein
MLAPLADYIEERLPADLGMVRARLRPPGAIGEKDFLNTCYRCGSCATSCPVEAISQVQGEDEDVKGTPQIEPRRQACTACEPLACMKACPSGALRPVERFDIRMGLAAMDYGACLRTKGEDCTECLRRCPLGDVAIKLDDGGRIRVIDPTGRGRGCIGCGLCEQYCPTTPKKAIRVTPY